jgi:short-subunit dehydrogenase
MAINDPVSKVTVTLAPILPVPDLEAVYPFLTVISVFITSLVGFILNPVLKLCGIPLACKVPGPINTSFHCLVAEPKDLISSVSGIILVSNPDHTAEAILAIVTEESATVAAPFSHLLVEEL